MINPLSNRPAQMATLLAASFGGPYAYFNVASDRPAAAAVASSIAGTGLPVSFDSAPVTNPAIRDLRQFVRFDATPGWVIETFPRVSTVLSNVQMDGLRVPVVTGTGLTDFAGTADYYFDRDRQLRRIVIDGRCGDPSAIAATLTQAYGVTPEPSLGGHLYTARWNNRVTSLALIQPAAVVYNQDIHQRYSLYIELNQPALEYGLSERGQEILQTAWQNLRWQ